MVKIALCRIWTLWLPKGSNDPVTVVTSKGLYKRRKYSASLRQGDEWKFYHLARMLRQLWSKLWELFILFRAFIWRTEMIAFPLFMHFGSGGSEVNADCFLDQWESFICSSTKVPDNNRKRLRNENSPILIEML